MVRRKPGLSGAGRNTGIHDHIVFVNYILNTFLPVTDSEGGSTHPFRLMLVTCFALLTLK